MAHFDPYLGLYCQNDEVSPDVHTRLHAKWTVRYPPITRSKLLLGDRPHLTSARASGGILNDLTFQRFAPDYD